MTPSVATKPDESDRLRELAGERYRNDQRLGGRWNETVDTILSHRSVRHYLPTPVPYEAVELAIAAAQSAPSSSNLQAWSVVAVENADRRSRLNAVAGNQRQIAQAPLLLIWLADLARPRAIATERGSTAEGLDYVESFLLGVIDAALAAQNAVVAFESLGLGTCYIGAIRNDPETVSRELGLPDGVFPVFGLTVGFPDPAVPAGVKPRLPQTTVLYRETYDCEPPEEDLADYNRVLQSFQSEQAMPLIDWTEQVRSRIATVESLKGRHVLGDVARRLGFKLK
ncbi:NADPH-dependent oxidoreductase [Rhizobium laguerreae]|uniref:NADPH-dependent oxidoreductase n=1 Tax=Rhizobium laguerreae TaxID=1076926 RepID=UPI001C912659|nr:NADPH-dependent oxidoreductase [Rhizobium laguerreae]MBY3321749.1 NADPH-dependent oxidoreductase [Rhizobium laguerreae]MBY3363075.1 NADPH-dependent oxidoreductase [Rhizobium laguerreae]